MQTAFHENTDEFDKIEFLMHFLCTKWMKMKYAASGFKISIAETATKMKAGYFKRLTNCAQFVSTIYSLSRDICSIKKIIDFMGSIFCGSYC